VTGVLITTSTVVSVDVDLYLPRNCADDSPVVGRVERGEGLCAREQEGVVDAARRRIDGAQIDLVVNANLAADMEIQVKGMASMAVGDFIL